MRGSVFAPSSGHRAVAEQECAISALNQPHALAEAAHGGVPLRHGFPCGGVDALGAEDDLCDFLVGGAGAATIDHPQHLAEIAPAVLTDALVGHRSSEAQGGRESSDGIRSIVKETIKEGSCRHRLLR